MVLTESIKQFIRDNYLVYSDVEIGRMFGLSKLTIKSFRQRNGLRVSTEQATQRRIAGLRERYDKVEHEHDGYIRDNYLHVSPQQMADAIGRSEMYIKGRMQKLGLHVPPEIIEQRKLASRIQPGTPPHNKGKRQSDFMTQEAIERTKATRFKKGNSPHNTLYDGAISIRKDKDTGRAYKWIRTGLAKWEMLHVKIWEEANGPVPDGSIVVFRDRDSLNVTLDNLECITKAENLNRNGINSLPPELREIHLLRGAIRRQINKHKQYGK